GRHHPAARHPPASRGRRRHRPSGAAAGDAGGAECRRRGAHPGRAQGGGALSPEGRAGDALRADHRLHDGAGDARAVGAQPQPRHGRLRPRLCMGRGCQADRLRGRAGNLPGHPPAGWARRHAELHRHPDLGELLRPCGGPHRPGLPAQPADRRGSAGGVAECRWRRRADAQDGLRHDPGGAAQHPAADARRLRAACEFQPCHRHRPRLRGEPDRRAAGGAAAGRAAAQHGHPGDGRQPEDRAGGHRLRARGGGRGQPRDAGDGAGERALRRAAMRRLGRVFGHHRQSGAGGGFRPRRAARRHGHPLREPGDLWGGASLHPPRGQRGGGAEAGRRDALVGGLHLEARRRDGCQPLPRQQAWRADHHPREVARSDGQGGLDQPRRCRALCGGGDAAGLRLHGHAGLRPGGGDGPGGGRGEPAVLHHRAGQRLRLQADPFHQARHQHADVRAHGGRHGHQLRHNRHRRGDGAAGGRAHLPAYAAHGERRADEERGVRFRRGGIRALADGRDHV
ncbi:MAG: Altronate dehydratase, partial [uncultured Craurococcus sp.]